MSALPQTGQELRQALAEARAGWSTSAWLAVAAIAVAALAVRFGPPLWAFAAGLVLGVVEASIANIHVAGWQLGPSYREVLPIAFVLLLISLWPSREALEERE